MGDYELIYLGVYVFIITAILIMSYKLTHKEYINYNYSVIFLFLLIISMMLLPEKFLWYLFLVFFIVLFYMIANIFIQSNFSNIEETLQIDKKKQVWDTHKHPPELKSKSLKLLQGEEIKNKEEK